MENGHVDESAACFLEMETSDLDRDFCRIFSENNEMENKERFTKNLFAASAAPPSV